jgi:hypothetical protein
MIFELPDRQFLWRFFRAQPVNVGANIICPFARNAREQTIGARQNYYCLALRDQTTGRIIIRPYIYEHEQKTTKELVVGVFKQYIGISNLSIGVLYRQNSDAIRWAVNPNTGFPYAVRMVKY